MLADKVVVAFEHAIVARRAVGEVHDAYALLRRQLLQVTIHRAETHAWKASPDARKDFLRRWMVVRRAHDVVHRCELTGLALPHGAARSSANEARTASLMVAVWR